MSRIKGTFWYYDEDAQGMTLYDLISAAKQTGALPTRPTIPKGRIAAWDYMIQDGIKKTLEPFTPKKIKVSEAQLLAWFREWNIDTTKIHSLSLVAVEDPSTRTGLLEGATTSQILDAIQKNELPEQYQVMTLADYNKAFVKDATRALSGEEVYAPVYRPNFLVRAPTLKFYDSSLKTATQIYSNPELLDLKPHILYHIKMLENTFEHSYLGAASVIGQMNRIRKGHKLRARADQIIQAAERQGFYFGPYKTQKDLIIILDKWYALRILGQEVPVTLFDPHGNVLETSVRQISPLLDSPWLEFITKQNDRPSVYNLEGVWTYLPMLGEEFTYNYQGDYKFCSPGEISNFQIRAGTVQSYLDGSMPWRLEHMGLLKGWRFTRNVVSKVPPDSNCGFPFPVKRGSVILAETRLASIALQQCTSIKRMNRAFLDNDAVMRVAFLDRAMAKEEVYQDIHAKGDITNPDEKVRLVYASAQSFQDPIQCMQKPVYAHHPVFYTQTVPKEGIILPCIGTPMVRGSADAMMNWLLEIDEETPVILIFADNLFLYWRGSWLSFDASSMEATVQFNLLQAEAIRVCNAWISSHHSDYGDFSGWGDQTWGDLMETSEKEEKETPSNISAAFLRYYKYLQPNFAVLNYAQLENICFKVPGLSSGKQGTGYMNTASMTPAAVEILRRIREEPERIYADLQAEVRHWAEKKGLKLPLDRSQVTIEESDEYVVPSPLLDSAVESPLATAFNKTGIIIKLVAVTGRLLHGRSLFELAASCSSGSILRLDFLGFDVARISNMNVESWVFTLEPERIYPAFCFDKFGPVTGHQSSPEEKLKVLVLRYMKFRCLYMIGAWAYPGLAESLYTYLTGLKLVLAARLKDSPLDIEMALEDFVDDEIAGGFDDEDTNFMIATSRKTALPTMGDVIRINCSPIAYHAYKEYVALKAIEESDLQKRFQFIANSIDVNDFVAYSNEYNDLLAQSIRPFVLEEPDLPVVQVSSVTLQGTPVETEKESTKLSEAREVITESYEPVIKGVTPYLSKELTAQIGRIFAQKMPHFVPTLYFHNLEYSMVNDLISDIRVYLKSDAKAIQSWMSTHPAHNEINYILRERDYAFLIPISFPLVPKPRVRKIGGESEIVMRFGYPKEGAIIYNKQVIQAAIAPLLKEYFEAFITPQIRKALKKEKWDKPEDMEAAVLDVVKRINVPKSLIIATADLLLEEKTKVVGAKLKNFGAAKTRRKKVHKETVLPGEESKQAVKEEKKKKARELPILIHKTERQKSEVKHRTRVLREAPT